MAVTSSCDQGDEMYSQLVQKEHDLILAAELGKALLDRNAELEKKQEKLTEDYSQRIEKLVQEKYELKLKQETLETEYESTCRELQNDVTALRHEMRQQEIQAQQADKTHSQVFTELAQQNERLTLQLRKSAKEENELQGQLHDLREQVHKRKTSIHEHITQLEVLRGEITMLNERKGDLERRILMLTDERDSLACNLEEAQDRILMLERQKIEHECLLRAQEKEISELQHHNSSLEDKVCDISVHMDSSAVHNTSVSSLFNELEMTQLSQSMSTDSLNEAGQTEAVHQHARRPRTLPIPAVMITSAMMAEAIDDDIEFDDDAMFTNISADSLSDPNFFQQLDSVYQTENLQFKQEVLDVYRHLKGMVHDLRGNRELFSPESIEISEIKVGSLLSACQELRELLQDLLQQKNAMNSDEEDQPESVRDPLLKVEIHRLKKDLLTTRHELARAKKESSLKDKELQNKSKEFSSLSGKISEHNGTIRQLMEERDKLQDAAAGLLTKDDIIEQTREERNQAIDKHNQLEVDLNKARMDILSLDSQLMDSIQQKLKLSQHLEEWQIDMEELIQVQVKQRLEQDTGRDSAGSTPSTPPQKKSPRRKFPFKL